MPSNDELCRMEAFELAGRVRAKEISPVEVVDAVLERMEKLEPELHAFCTPTPELAREEARRVEEKISSGGGAGPLAGVPVGIKDLHAAKGIRMACGSRAYEDFVPDEDDVAVERLKDAGAVVLGKTNVPEFGYSGVSDNPVFESTRNPWDTRLTSGGSSAGSAAAVATGMGPIALGSDGGGSVRIPASFCGLYGMKASMGRVPLYPSCRDERYPGMSSWESLEHIGPVSRTVRDAALMLSVMAGPDERDRHSLPEPGFDWLGAPEGGAQGLRVAYSPDWGYAAVEPEVRRVVGEAVQAFEEDLGCVVEEAHPGFEDPYEAFWALLANETDLVGMREMAEELGEGMSPHIVAFLQEDWTAEDLTNAVMTRKGVYNRMWRFMREGPYDLLLTPTLALPPFETGMQGPEVIEGREVDPFYWLSFTFPINLTGQPAATVPAGFTAEGLPVGMQIVGRHLDDALVLRASAAFGAPKPWKDRWPAMLESAR